MKESNPVHQDARQTRYPPCHPNDATPVCQKSVGKLSNCQGLLLKLVKWYINVSIRQIANILGLGFAPVLCSGLVLRCRSQKPEPKNIIKSFPVRFITLSVVLDLTTASRQSRTDSLPERSGLSLPDSGSWPGGKSSSAESNPSFRSRQAGYTRSGWLTSFFSEVMAAKNKKRSKR